MDNFVLVCIENENVSNVTNYLFKNNVYFKDLKCINSRIYLKIVESSTYLVINHFSNSYIVNHGNKQIKYFFVKHYIFIISFIISIIILYFLSNTIFSININTSDNIVRDRIISSLENNNVSVYKYFPSSNRLKIIKSDILNNNKDIIDWLEIKRVGTSFIVDLNTRSIISNREEETISNIVAKKDGLIKYLYVSSGSKVKEVNELVHKGEVIISSNITKDEKIVNSVKASGKVYAEVWYKVNSTVPFKHTIYYNTLKSVNHIYMSIFGKKITLVGKYETNNSLNSSKILIDKPYLNFKVILETKELYDYKKVNLSEEEAYNEAVRRSDKVINDKLNEDEYIIDKKVLKKIASSSKIELEVFYRVYENIGEVRNVETLEGE